MNETTTDAAAPALAPAQAQGPVAVFVAGSRQYSVRQGDEVLIDLRAEKGGEALSFATVCAIKDGQQVTIGAPYVSGAVVHAKVRDVVVGKKLLTHKYRRRHACSKSRKGHRQRHTRIRITEISV